MPNTNREWGQRLRDAQRALRDAKRSRRYVVTAQLLGVMILATGITLCAVFSAVGWVMLGLLGLGMFGIATAMALEWTIYQDVQNARDRMEDLTADYEEWKYEQAQAIVRSS